MARDLSSEELHILQLFAANTRRLLKSRGLTQQKLAQDIGAKPSTVSRWLSGHTIPDVVWAVKIAHELEASVDEMLERKVHGSMPEIRKYAKLILKLAGGEDRGVQKRATKRG